MDLLDPDLIAQMIATQEAYEFRLAIIKGITITCAIVLVITVLVLLLEDFFQE